MITTRGQPLPKYKANLWTSKCEWQYCCGQETRFNCSSAKDHLGTSFTMVAGKSSWQERQPNEEISFGYLFLSWLRWAQAGYRSLPFRVTYFLGCMHMQVLSRSLASLASHYSAVSPSLLHLRHSCSPASLASCMSQLSLLLLIYTYATLAHQLVWSFTTQLSLLVFCT